MNNDFSESLLKFFDIVEYIAPQPKTAKDFKRIYDRHLKEYQKKYPGASIEQFRQYSIEKLTQWMEVVKNDPKAKSAPNTDIFRWAEIYVNDYLKADSGRTGISGTLNIDQLKALHKVMVKGKYITGNESDFIAALTPNPLPPGFKPVKWIHKSKQGRTAQQSNKSSLYTFLYVLKGMAWAKPTDGHVFSDTKGKPITLNKPNDFATLNYLDTFELMIKSIK